MITPIVRLSSLARRIVVVGGATVISRVKYEAVMLAWHGWQRLDAILPRPVRFLLATVIGEIVYWVLAEKRAITLVNMRQVLGPEASEAQVVLMAKRSFRNYVKYLSEFAHLPRWADDDLEPLMASVSGWEHIEDALAEGKGVIFVSLHFGNWDVAGWFFGKRHPLAAVADPLQPPELDVVVQGWRRAKHMEIIPTANAARGVMRALQNGGQVVLVADRPTHAQEEGAHVRFFGAWTRVPAGAAHFALKTGAPVVISGAWRTPANTYMAFALPPLRFTGTGDRRRDVDAVMQRIMQDVETVVREHPDQWYMFRHMWPPQPARQAASRPIQQPHDHTTLGPAVRSTAAPAIRPVMPSVSRDATGT